MLLPIGDENVRGGKPPILSYSFIAINILIFIWQTRFDGMMVCELGAIPADIRDLNYSNFFDEGESVISQAHEYHSHNTKQLTQGELKNVLLGLREIQDDLKEFKLDNNRGNAND